MECPGHKTGDDECNRRCDSNDGRIFHARRQRSEVSFTPFEVPSKFKTHTGYLGKKRLSVVSTGIGTDNIDIVLQELDALVNIDFANRIIKQDLKHLNIIRIGTSGSLQKNIAVDDYVASSHGLGIDNLLNFYRLEQNEEEKQL